MCEPLKRRFNIWKVRDTSPKDVYYVLPVSLVKVLMIFFILLMILIVIWTLIGIRVYLFVDIHNIGHMIQLWLVKNV